MTAEQIAELLARKFDSGRPKNAFYTLEEIEGADFSFNVGSRDHLLEKILEYKEKIAIYQTEGRSAVSMV